MLGEGHTYWDVIEFKLLVFFLTLLAAVWIGNWLHKKDKDEQ
jgi:hypothetical protein